MFDIISSAANAFHFDNELDTLIALFQWNIAVGEATGSAVAVESRKHVAAQSMKTEKQRDKLQVKTACPKRTTGVVRSRLKSGKM